ncbi:MAG: RMD1 family protein [Bacteroidota bacterium]|nr:RMD1 family protein [Bacteroidota bacterium]MDP4217533.1 RMD1 family protein [Bacteroidota bacterium]MDP4248044.1 RMD1 family protein [Bacteroidota bacterium]MDP4253477.1 RMD1 family protein [Bacteroidota bacterium]MDP4259438.1 RMD1 family protein [Bacteroidota bacterium]
MLHVVSYQIADNIDVKSCRLALKEEPYHYDADELFYRTAEQAFVYVFKYGVVCFLNHDESAANRWLEKIAPFCRNLFDKRMSEEFQVETNATENRFGYNKIEIINADVETLRLIMLNVSQSVALDYYSELTNLLLDETKYHTQRLEQKGRLDISGQNLKKYIGKTLNLKNRIADNLYIFDSPPETWDDENLNRIDLGLKRTFDLQERYRDIREGLEIIKENLELFKDLLQYRNSTFLEWIIIILVALEVVNLILDKLFK